MNQKLVKAILHNIFGKGGVYLVQLLFLMVFARLFTPVEFGIYASLQIFVVFFQLFSQAGLSAALISYTDINKSQLNGLNTITLLLGICVAAIFYIFSYGLNYFYGNENYENYSWLLSLAIIFQSVSIVAYSTFAKELKFILLARVDIVSEFTSGAVVVLLFYFDFGLYALISKPLSTAFIRFFLLKKSELTNTETGLTRFSTDFSVVHEIFHFTKNQFAFSFVNYWSQNLDNLLIGKFLGLSALGIYDKAYQLMKYPLQLISFSLGSALLPVMKTEKLTVDEYRKLNENIAKNMAIFSIPAGIYLHFFANEIVMLILGEQWLEVVPVLEVLAMIIPLQMILSTAGAFFQAAYKTNILLFSGLISLFVNIIAISVGIAVGTLEAVAYSILISYSLNFFISYWLLYRYVFLCTILSFYKKIIGVIFIYIIPVIALFSYNTMIIPGESIVDTLKELIIFTCIFIAFNPILYSIVWKKFLRISVSARN